jgi:hypothetical protein
MSDPQSPSDDRGLSGKVAIVTGGGAPDDGIGNGRAAAILLARAGARGCWSSTFCGRRPSRPWR